MKKIGAASLLGVALLLIGCGGSNQPNIPKKDSVKISYSGTLAYAYLKDGENLVEISTRYKEPEDGIEVIKINYGGFSPDYSIPNGKQACIYSAAGDKEKQKRDKDYKFCHSSFAVSTVGGKAIDIFANALVTVSTVGLNAATGTVSRMMEFDREKFLEAVKRNDLQRYRKKILEARSAAEEGKRRLEDLYGKMTTPYQKRAREIELLYKTEDRSGLAPKSFKIEERATILPHQPPAMPSGYYDLVEFSATPQSFDTKIAQIVEKIGKRSEEDLVRSKDDLKKAYSSYDLVTEKEVVKRYNDHIAFHAAVQAPKSISADAVSQPVEIRYIVDYADISAMFPREFKLSDENFAATFYPAGDDSVVAIGANKTKSFVVLKTITLYYAGAVNSLTNLNVEIAPESVTLKSNSVYPVVSQKQRRLAHIKRATYDTLKDKSVDYGYAVKYRIEKTNVDKSLYHTQSFPLLDIYRSYL